MVTTAVKTKDGVQEEKAIRQICEQFPRLFATYFDNLPVAGRQGQSDRENAMTMESGRWEMRSLFQTVASYVPQERFTHIVNIAMGLAGRTGDLAKAFAQVWGIYDGHAQMLILKDLCEDFTDPTALMEGVAAWMIDKTLDFMGMDQDVTEIARWDTPRQANGRDDGDEDEDDEWEEFDTDVVEETLGIFYHEPIEHAVGEVCDEQDDAVPSKAGHSTSKANGKAKAEPRTKASRQTKVKAKS